MQNFIDKAAWIYLQDKKILTTLSKGKNAYYIPGGKIEKKETHQQAIIREIKEELSVDIVPESIKFYGIFEAPAHGKPPGTVVRMNCFMANFAGELKPDHEIEALEFFSYADRDKVGPVDKLIFDDLKERGLLE